MSPADDPIARLLADIEQHRLEKAAELAALEAEATDPHADIEPPEADGTPTVISQSYPLEEDDDAVSELARRRYSTQDTELQSGRGVDHVTAGHLGHLNDSMDTSVEALVGEDGRTGIAADVREIRVLLAELVAIARAAFLVLGTGGILCGVVAIVVAFGFWLFG